MLAKIGTSLLLILANCGDNLTPLYWSDAETVWSESWCRYAQRCNNDAFMRLYSSQEGCLADVLSLNCSTVDCQAQYPSARQDNIDLCEADMSVVATVAPQSCRDAFNP